MWENVKPVKASELVPFCRYSTTVPRRQTDNKSVRSYLLSVDEPRKVSRRVRRPGRAVGADLLSQRVLVLLGEQSWVALGKICKQQQQQLNTTKLLTTGLCILLRVYQSIYIETSVRNKCWCSFYCALLSLHVSNCIRIFLCYKTT
jgi:hypothetical protein